MKLENIDENTRGILAKKFIEEVILPQWKTLQTWSELSGQTSQIDFGYLAQHLVSILTGKPGAGQRGKGIDLADGSEVKAASCLDAADTPRWNNVNCGQVTKADLVAKYNSIPYMFFVLLDTTERKGSILRCRVWAIQPSLDKAFTKVAYSWADGNTNGKKENLQLHPPRWEEGLGNITTNNAGNLKLPLLFHSEQIDVPGILVMNNKVFNPKLENLPKAEYISRTNKTTA